MTVVVVKKPDFTDLGGGKGVGFSSPITYIEKV